MHSRLRTSSCRRVAAQFLFLIVGALPLGAQQGSAPATSPPHRIVLAHAEVFDGSATWRHDCDIVVDDSMITAVAPAKPWPAGSATVIDVRGRFVIPGLIDTHVHLATDPDHEDTRERAMARLAAALHGGVTTVRDMAGDTRVLAGYARTSLLTAAPIPNIYYAALFAGPSFFSDPRTHASAAGAVAGDVPWMRAVTAQSDFPRLVAEAKGTGATAIKMYAALDSVTAAAIVAEAHRQGMAVWAHAALRPATPSQVAASGLDAMSHANLVAQAMPRAERTAFNQKITATHGTVPVTVQSPALDSVLRTMADRKIAFDPTLFVMNQGAELELAGAVTRRARELGVIISTGTDSIAAADSTTLPNVHHEIELLVTKAGFTPAEALVAATLNGAKTLGIASHVGTVAAGKRADLAVLAADPLRDIRNTTSVTMVLKRGMVLRSK